MKWLAITITIISPADTAELAQELVGNLFYDLGLSGLVIEGPTDVGKDRGESALTGYISADAAAREKQEQLEEAAIRLAERHSFVCRVLARTLDDQDWATAWKEHFYPQKIGQKIVVKPTWKKYAAGDNQEIVIELDPGMAFGTGTHPTTRMCVKMIEKYIKTGDAFLDIGTGSGLLMIAAHKMGADVLRGTDNDPVAIRVAGENLRGNHISGKTFQLLSGELTAGVRGPFDCIAANILTEVIVQLIPAIPSLLTRRGYFICSGITAAKKHLVDTALRQQGMEIKECLEEEEWTCLISTLSQVRP